MSMGEFAIIVHIRVMMDMCTLTWFLVRGYKSLDLECEVFKTVKEVGEVLQLDLTLNK